MNSTRLLILANFLDKLDARKFDRWDIDIFNIVNPHGKNYSSPPYLSVIFPELSHFAGGVDVGALINFFQISINEACAMFSSFDRREKFRIEGGFPSEKEMRIEDFTPQYVAKDIRDFVEREGAK